MKYFKNLLLVNWNGFSYEVLPFGKVSFLTGQNRSGKSSIIDAIQLLIFGDTDGRAFFNKAANERSSRTLLGYLFGERDTGERYIRNSHFVSYVAGEIVDYDKGLTTLIVFAANCKTEGNRDFTHIWSIVPNTSISDVPFVSLEDGKKIPLGLEAFKAVVKDRGGEIYHENKKYLKNLQLYEGFMGEGGGEYLGLLRKAIPFSIRANDLRGFINEYICKKADKVDVSETKENLKTVQETKKVIKNIENDIERLEEIAKADKVYRDKKNAYLIDDYCMSKANVDNAELKYSTAIARMEKREAESKDKKDVLAQIETDQKVLTEAIQRLNAEIAASDKEQERLRLEDDKKRLAQEADKKKRNAEHVISLVKSIGYAIRNIAARSQSLLIDLPQPEFSLSDIEEMSQETFLGFKPEAFAEYQGDLYRNIVQQQVRFENEKSGCEAEQKKLTKRLEDLQNGLKPFPSGVESFRNMLNERFGKECRILADCVEVKDPEWRDAIESVLGDRRFDILLSHDEYVQARDIILEFEGKNVAAVDVSQVQSTTICQHSLADVLAYSDDDARKYVACLVGGISKDESSGFYITKEAIYSEVRRIAALNKIEPFLGGKAVAIQIEQARKSLDSINGRLKEIFVRISFLKQSETDLRTRVDLQRIREAIDDVDSLESIYQEIRNISERLASLFDEEIEAKKAELNQKHFELDALVNEKADVIGAIRNFEKEIETIKETLPSLEKYLTEYQKILENKGFTDDWIKSTGEPVYQKSINDSNGDFGTVISSFTGRKNNSKYIMENAFNARNNLRVAYKQSFHFGADPYEESNEKFDSRLEELGKKELLKYKEKLEGDEERANKVFHESFIYGIKSSIEDAEARIRVINKTLDKLNFGGTSYRFSIERNTGEYGRFYDMFRDERLVAKENVDLFNDNSGFFKDYSSEIEKLFSVFREDDMEKKGDVEVLTDYRTYLSFDLIETDSQGKSRSLAKMASKQSGGETQLAFYICITAAFAQICRVYESVQNDTFRLIIFDEAFSKMDGERIAKFMKWFSTINLQLLVCTPTEKVGQIFVDKSFDGYLVARRGDTMMVRNLAYEEITEWKE